MGMSTEQLGILLGGISSILAVLIYFTKNIKQSSCCGNECNQQVLDGHGDPIRSTMSIAAAQAQLAQQIPQLTPPLPAPTEPPRIYPRQAIL